MRCVVVGDADADADAGERRGGHLLDVLSNREADVVWLERSGLAHPWSSAGVDLVVLLGSRHSAHDAARRRDVEAEEDLVRVSVGSGVPVLGIGYGSHIAARALGGTSYRADQPDLGWRRVDTIDSVLCPEGPWAHVHRDVFVPAPTSRVIGSTWHGPQCFIDESWPGPVLAWQFHPEATADAVRVWLEQDADLVRSNGSDVRALLAETRVLAPRARRASVSLFEAALDFLGVGVQSA